VSRVIFSQPTQFQLRNLARPSGFGSTLVRKALAFYQISSSVGLPMANDVRFKIILTPEIIDHQSTFEILI
jgi:hypothetical protein